MPMSGSRNVPASRWRGECQKNPATSTHSAKLVEPYPSEVYNEDLFDPKFVHARHKCDECRVCPIIGFRYHAYLDNDLSHDCNYDLCHVCYTNIVVIGNVPESEKLFKETRIFVRAQYAPDRYFEEKATDMSTRGRRNRCHVPVLNSLGQFAKVASSSTAAKFIRNRIIPGHTSYLVSAGGVRDGVQKSLEELRKKKLCDENCASVQQGYDSKVSLSNIANVRRASHISIKNKVLGGEKNPHSIDNVVNSTNVVTGPKEDFVNHQCSSMLQVTSLDKQDDTSEWILENESVDTVTLFEKEEQEIIFENDVEGTFQDDDWDVIGHDDMDLGHAAVILGSIMSQEQGALLNSDPDCNNVSIVSDADSFVASDDKFHAF